MICHTVTSDDTESAHRGPQNSRQNMPLHLITSESSAGSKITVVNYLQV